jgi:hypothetical protein
MHPVFHGPPIWSAIKDVDMMAKLNRGGEQTTTEEWGGCYLQALGVKTWVNLGHVEEKRTDQDRGGEQTTTEEWGGCYLHTLGVKTWVNLGHV